MRKLLEPVEADRFIGGEPINLTRALRVKERAGLHVPVPYADLGCLCCERQTTFGFDQLKLGVLVLGDVPIDADELNGVFGRLCSHNAAGGDPADLAIRTTNAKLREVSRA